MSRHRGDPLPDRTVALTQRIISFYVLQAAPCLDHSRLSEVNQYLAQSALINCEDARRQALADQVARSLLHGVSA